MEKFLFFSLYGVKMVSGIMSLDKVHKNDRKTGDSVFFYIHEEMELSTPGGSGKGLKFELYTNLYTLSTRNGVDIVVYIVFFQNECFGKVY